MVAAPTGSAASGDVMTTPPPQHHAPAASGPFGTPFEAEAAGGGADHEPHGDGFVARWRRNLDGAVRIGWAGRLLALLGGWLAVAAILIVALAAIDVAVGDRAAPFPPYLSAVVIMVISGVAAGLMPGRRMTRCRRPTRLSAALATERAQPALGERLSSAVEFLTDLPPGDSEPGPSCAVTRALRRLAVEQAAMAARDARMAVPGLAIDLRWLAAGILLPAAVWLSTLLLPSPWGEAVGRSLFRTVGADAEAALAARGAGATGGPAAAAAASADAVPGLAAAGLPPAATQAAARIAAVARLERRLADRLAVVFAQAPGVPRESLPRGPRNELDELAAVQSECLQAMHSERETLRLVAAAAAGGEQVVSSPAAGGLAAAVVRLDDLDQVDLSASPSHIRANRLALATALAADAAAILNASAGLLGISSTDGVAGDGGRSSAAGPLLRATATLDRMLGEAAGGSAADGAARGSGSIRAATPPEEIAAAPAAAAEGDAALNQAGPHDTDTTDPRAGAAAGTAGRTASAASRSRPAAPAASAPIERVWSLLPGGDRAEAGRGAIDALPAAYRPAIDAYYRLLLEATTGGRSAGPPPRTPPAPAGAR